MKYGDEILCCDPFAHVVSRSMHDAICDFCLSPASQPNTKLFKCTGCKYVYYCGRDCQKPAWRLHKPECTYLKAIDPKVPTDTVRLMARIIYKLRLGGSKEVVTLPDGNRRSFYDLMSHGSEVIQDKCRISAFHVFFEVLQDCFRCDVPPKPEVLDIFGTILINSFNIMSSEDYQSIGIGLYLEPSVIDHSCKPNATVVFEGRKLIVRYIGEPNIDVQFKDIRISYTNLLYDTKVRQRILRKQYYFDCHCDECDHDPRQVDAFKRGSLSCPSCAEAVAVSEAPRPESVTCRHCETLVPSAHLQKYFTLKIEVDANMVRHEGLDQPEPNEKCLQMAKKLHKIFHPFMTTYYIILEASLEKAITSEDWESAMFFGKDLLTCYFGLYPRFDINTGLLALKLAKIAHLLSRVEDAFKLIVKAEDILHVTHGENHSLTHLVKQEFDNIRSRVKGQNGQPSN